MLTKLVLQVQNWPHCNVIFMIWKIWILIFWGFFLKKSKQIILHTTIEWIKYQSVKYTCLDIFKKCFIYDHRLNLLRELLSTHLDTWKIWLKFWARSQKEILPIICFGGLPELPLDLWTKQPEMSLKNMPKTLLERQKPHQGKQD